MNMTEFLIALLTIVVIDLVLAGDNAIVIGLAARNLPKEQQKKVIIWGTVGAIVLRMVLTGVVVYLLEISGLRLAAGLVLVYIAYKLMVDDGGHGNVKAGKSMFAAIQTIIVADTVMGLDNVLAVASAAHGDMLLVILGLIISVPIMVWGSTLILKWIERFPAIIYIGSAVLAWTAVKMMVEEPVWGISDFFHEYGWIKYILAFVVMISVVGIGYLKNKRNKKA